MSGISNAPLLNIHLYTNKVNWRSNVTVYSKWNSKRWGWALLYPFSAYHKSFVKPRSCPRKTDKYCLRVLLFHEQKGLIAMFLYRRIFRAFGFLRAFCLPERGLRVSFLFSLRVDHWSLAIIPNLAHYIKQIVRRFDKFHIIAFYFHWGKIPFRLGHYK